MIDKDRATKAVEDLLKALGQDVENEHLKDTPKRVAEMFVTQCTRESESLDKVFQETFDELVMLRDIPFVSCCSHHMVFYYGRAHIGYIPHHRVLGLSKLARLIADCSSGLTMQEAVTREIADRLWKELDPRGCMIVIEATHGCMNLRGARTVGTSAVTSAVRGVFRDVPAARAEFMSLVSKGGPR